MNAIFTSGLIAFHTAFIDDPNLLNVAVSRAKKSLQLIVSGNDQQKDGIIQDLIDYIDYNNFSIEQSSIHSIFDFLYTQYTKRRIELLKSTKKISEYDSENLMYLLITEVLQDDKFTGLQVLCHHPLNMVIRDYTLLDIEEQSYAKNCATHLDFLIYDQVSKKTILAIEVDGYQYHKKGTTQAIRDQKKDHILQLYNIPFLRLTTNGSNEKDKIINKLDSILG